MLCSNRLVACFAVCIGKLNAQRVNGSKLLEQLDLDTGADDVERTTLELAFHFGIYNVANSEVIEKRWHATRERASKTRLTVGLDGLPRTLCC